MRWKREGGREGRERVESTTYFLAALTLTKWSISLLIFPFLSMFEPTDSWISSSFRRATSTPHDSPVYRLLQMHVPFRQNPWLLHSW